MKINLHIDRLVLEGLPLERRQGFALQAAVETELARLLTAHGLAADSIASVAVPRLDGYELTLAPGAAPASMGEQIAHAVYQGLDRNFIQQENR